jgi:hypothetical protein
LFTIGAFFAAKRFIFDRFVPISQIEGMIKDGKFKNILAGNLLMLCYVRGPTSMNGWSYCFSGLGGVQPSTYFDKVQ